MKKVFVILACGIPVLVCAALIVGCLAPPAAPQLRSLPHIERTEVVERVIDGDTIVLEGGERVRLDGINTPEIGRNEEPGGVEAKDFVENFCPPGTEVGLDVNDLGPKDRYGRTIAVVYVKVDNIWVNLNAEILRAGHAEIMIIPPSEFNPYDWIN
jgi:endonuclease YncB( thermonuclease family)